MLLRCSPLSAATDHTGAKICTTTASEEPDLLKGAGTAPNPARLGGDVPDRRRKCRREEGLGWREEAWIEALEYGTHVVVCLRDAVLLIILQAGAHASSVCVLSSCVPARVQMERAVVTYARGSNSVFIKLDIPMCTVRGIFVGNT